MSHIRFPLLASTLLFAALPLVSLAQTRRIAAASHSGIATSRDEDNFGVSMEQIREYRQRRDSLARVDSLRQQDSLSQRVRRKR